MRHEVCAQTAWRTQRDTLDVSVNVSGRQLDDESIVADIQGALASSGLAAGSLVIEVMETALMRNAAATTRRLNTIKQLGVRIAIDDFGTGDSSLAYLRQFPVDCLKIDREFTSAVTTSPESRVLITTLVQLGQDLGLTTLAEGIETTYEMDILRDANVDEAHGFLMSRPLNAADLEALIPRTAARREARPRTLTRSPFKPPSPSRSRGRAWNNGGVTKRGGKTALRSSKMTQRSKKWLGFVGALLVLDLALTLHTALTWTAQPNGPTIMPAGEAIGWFTTVILAVWAALIIIGAIRPARDRGWTDPTRQDRMAPHKPVNIHRSTPSAKP